MPNQHPVYLATVGLDCNRWSSRIPSIKVSEWLPRITADGFDGIELWEFHDLHADKDEQARLTEVAAPLAIYNTYAGFSDDPDEKAQRARVAEAIARFQAGAVKYNVGRDASRIGEYRQNMLAWDKEAPPACRLLCECHPGTVLETIDGAFEFFSDLDPARFGIIAHLSSDKDPASLDHWLNTFGKRVQHLHLQLRDPSLDPASTESKQQLAGYAQVLGKHHFAGSASIEFTRGIGKDENVETLYANALIDLAWYRSIFAD